MLRFLLIVSLTAVAGSSRAGSPSRDCMTAHMVEAVAMNRERAPLYARRDPRAAAISRRLIVGEWIIRQSAARWLDAQARPFQERGLSILCDEFVSMDSTPAPGIDSARAPPLASFVRIDTAALADRLAGPAARESFGEVARLGRERLRALAHEPRFNCMTRHTLESIVRAADLAPAHETKARVLNLPSTRALSRRLIVAQIMGLRWTGGARRRGRAGAGGRNGDFVQRRSRHPRRILSFYSAPINIQVAEFLGRGGIRHVLEALDHVRNRAHRETPPGRRRPRS